MPEEDTVQLLLCTRNEELAGRLRRLLEHWAQENCVRAAVTVSPALPGAAPDLLFLDGDTAEALPPERPAALGRAGVVVRNPRERPGMSRWSILLCGESGQ